MCQFTDGRFGFRCNRHPSDYREGTSLPWKCENVPSHCPGDTFNYSNVNALLLSRSSRKYFVGEQNGIAADSRRASPHKQRLTVPLWWHERDILTPDGLSEIDRRPQSTDPREELRRFRKTCRWAIFARTTVTSVVVKSLGPVRTREHLLHHKSVNINHAFLQEVQRQPAQFVILGPIAGQFTPPDKEDKIIRTVPMLNQR
jgi:hypothetical protein